MRKNSPRKWLHACLDLLPVILIPVFMVYSHRHTIDSGSITREEPLIYNLQQLVVNGKPTSTDYWNADINCRFDFEDLEDSPLEIHQVSLSQDNFDCSCVVDGVFNGSDIIYFSFNYELNYIDDGTFFVDVGAFDVYPSGLSGFYSDYGVYGLNSPDELPYFYIGGGNTYSSPGRIDISYLQLFNLTTIFGSGNEPTKEVFESYLTLDYYDFGVDYYINVGTHQVTYDDTDIMSQFTYQLYNAVDKYFNMGNVFNMNGVYEWFNTNIFGGNAPISIYIVWNIVLYEFVMDLLFLLYGLFMWFIDIVQHIMDKPFKSIK